jgi:hypothetical protein
MSDRTVAAATEQEARIRFFLADDIRAAPDGKITLVGLHPDNVLIGSAEPGTPPPSAELPHAIANVAILVNVTGAVGRHPVSVELIGASTAMKLPKDQMMQFGPGRAMNMILIFQPLTFASYGKKALRIAVGNALGHFEFEVVSKR